MEPDAKEPTGVTRGQNVVQVVPLDWSAAEQLLAPLVDRIEPVRAETQLVIVTADSENAAAAAHALVALVGNRPIGVLAATASPRAARLLRAAPVHVVVGAPGELLALMQASLLKPEHVRGIVFSWLDPILDTPDASPLENLLAELPKDAARVVLSTQLTPAYETFIERYARRARRAGDDPQDDAAPALSAEYVATAPSARGNSLRRLLDALDLPRAELYARNELLRNEGSTIARSLGYAGDAIRVVATGGAPSGDPLVLLELPVSRDEMRALAGVTGRKIYALVQPSQVGSLRVLLGGGTVAPVALIDAAERARGKDAAMRASLRDVIGSAELRREILALEPLLAEFDGLEIAAAALHLLEQQRPTKPPAAAQAGPMQRLFVNLGEKDGVRAPEIVTAITTEAGIPGSQVGRVEIRDTHSIVEVAAAVAELVVGKISGAMVRGRRVQARLDQPREERPARSAPARGAARPFDKRGGPSRPGATRGGPPHGDRPSRPFNRDAGPPRKPDHDGGHGRPTRPRPPRDRE